MVCPVLFLFLFLEEIVFKILHEKSNSKLKEQKRKNKNNVDAEMNPDECIKHIIYSSQLFSYEKTAIKERTLFSQLSSVPNVKV